MLYTSVFEKKIFYDKHINELSFILQNYPQNNFNIKALIVIFNYFYIDIRC